MAGVSSWARSIWRVEWIAGSDLVVLHVDKLIGWASIRDRDDISLATVSSRELGLSALAGISIRASDESSNSTRTRHLGVFFDVEFSFVWTEEARRTAISLEGSRNVRLTSVSIRTLSTVATDGTTDRALRRRVTVQSLSSWAEFSRDGSTTVVSVFKSVETAEIVGWARSINVDKTFANTHVSGVNVSLFSIRTNVHISGSTTDTVGGKRIVGAQEVAGTAVAQSSITFIWQVGIGVYVSDVSRSTSSGETEVVTLFHRLEVVQVSAASVVSELSTLLGDDVEVITSSSRRTAGGSLLWGERADVSSSGTTSVDNTASRSDRSTLMGRWANIGRRANHQLTELVSFWSTSVGASSNSTVTFTVFTSSEVVGVSVTSVVLVGFTFLSLGVVEVSVRRSRSTSDTLVGRERASIGLGRTATPDVSVEVAFIVNWTDVSCSRVGADVVVSLVVLVGISLRTLRLS